MDDTLKERMRNHLRKNEGVEPQPYRDTNGNLTVGVGFNVEKKEDFVALKFQTKDAKTGKLRDATTEEKTAEYVRLSKMDGKSIKEDTDLNQTNPLPGRSSAYGPYTKLGPVIEDGQYGPQTDFALKYATARLGPAKVLGGFALGRRNTFARQA